MPYNITQQHKPDALEFFRPYSYDRRRNSILI